MEFKVDGWNNFCRVFEVPNEFPTSYCFAGGIPVTFPMVDWFNPVPGLGQPAVSKEAWLKEFGDFEGMETEIEYAELCTKLTTWLQDKVYVKTGSQYLVLCDFGMSFTFKKN